MIDIDLSKISKEIGEPTARFVASSEEQQQKGMVYAFSAAFFVLFLVGCGGFWYLEKANIATAAGTQVQISELQRQNDELLRVEQEGNAIQLRNISALGILANTPAWSYIFDGLAKITPKGIVFNRFEVEKKDSLRMTGVSPDYETVSKFMVVMRESDLFTNVALASSSLTQKEGKTSVEYSITFGVSRDITRRAFEVKAKTIEENAQIKAETPAADTMVAPAPAPNTQIETPIDQNTGLPVF